LKTGLGFSARPNGPENLKKSHVIETEFQPGLKSDLGNVQLFCFPGNKMAAATKEKHFQWNKENKIENLIRCLANFKAQLEYKNIDLHIRRTRRAWRFLLFLCKYVFLAERLVGFYHAKKLKIERRQKAKL